MSRPPGVEMHRRAFLSSCGALALALTGCQPLLSRTRLGRLALDDPHPDDYAPVLRALIETMLPFDHPRFPPISAEAIQARLLALFPLEENEKYLVLQRGLMIFNQIDLYPVLQSPLVAEERALLEPDGTSGHASDAAIAECARQDQRLYSLFQRTLPADARTFVALQAVQRADYFRLWERSGFNGKRLFHSAAKRFVLATAWSHEDFWRAIDYSGPLLARRP